MRQRRGLRSPWLGIVLLACSLILGSLTAWTYLGARYPNLPGLPGTGAATTATAIPSPTPTLPPPTPTPVPTLAPLPPDLPLAARSAIVVDAESSHPLFERDVEQPLAPGSTMKIVTALTVLRHAGLEQIVTVAPEDVVDPAAESSMGLQAGDTVTVYDLLVGLLVPSGNDAANALARVIGGTLPGDAPPRERFVAEMNRVAADLGMRGSHFAGPSGDDEPGQVVTARDLAVAARALLREPALLSIVAMPSAEVRVGGPHARVLRLENTNALLAQDGVFGVKTGTTPEAGQCLVVAYRGHGRPEIAVILGSSDRYADARLLLGLPAPPATPTP